MFMTSLLLDILSQIFHQKKKKKLYLPVINYLQLFSSDVFSPSSNLVLSKTTVSNYTITEVVLSSPICFSGLIRETKKLQPSDRYKPQYIFGSFSFLHNFINSVEY